VRKASKFRNQLRQNLQELDMSDRYLPRREAITAFGNGGFRFGDYSHQGSLLILPSGMRAWAPQSFADVTFEDFQVVIHERDAVDFVLLGTGDTMMHPSPQLRASLAQAELPFDCMSTSAAISTYNVLQAEGRRVAAALIAVARPQEARARGR
jgi:uncharacterized protein